MQKKFVAITFDDPELNYGNRYDSNSGKQPFADVAFFGRIRRKSISFDILKNKNLLRIIFYIGSLLFYTLTSFKRRETMFDILEKNGVRVTFFKLVKSCILEPLYESEIRKYNHEIELHGYDHRPLIDTDISKIGPGFKSYSAPYGNDKELDYFVLSDLGIRNIRMYNQSCPYMYFNDILHVKYYSLFDRFSMDSKYLVVNLHALDLYPWRLARLNSLIKKLNLMGYTFVTFNELCEIIKTR